MTKLDSAAAARVFQAEMKKAWSIAGPKNTKAIEQLSMELEPMMRQRGTPIQVLPDSTLHDNLFKDKARISRWIFVYSLWVVLSEYMRRKDADPALLGTLEEWEKKHARVRAGSVVDPSESVAEADGKWWSAYASVVPGWQGRYLDLEPQANRLQFYESRFVPELLQTADYARAAITHLMPAAPKDVVDALVELRMHRQSLAEGTAIWVLLKQAVLLRGVGDRQVMRGQYRRLLGTYSGLTTSVQVLPALSGAATALRDPYTILRFLSSDINDMAYLPHLESPPELRHAFYLEDPVDLSIIVGRFSSIGRQALSRNASNEHIRKLLRDR